MLLNLETCQRLAEFVPDDFETQFSYVCYSSKTVRHHNKLIKQTYGLEYEVGKDYWIYGSKNLVTGIYKAFDVGDVIRLIPDRIDYEDEICDFELSKNSCGYYGYSEIYMESYGFGFDGESIEECITKLIDYLIDNCLLPKK